MKIRDITSEDQAALIRFHERCSAQTHYLRFGASKPHLREDEAKYFCEVDGVHHGAVVAYEEHRPNEIRGVGRWVESDDGAELAFVVEDIHQRRGIGRQLVEEVVRRARANGYQRLHAECLPSNRIMRTLASQYPDITVTTL